MHTAICTFEDRQLAEQAVDRLVAAGFARRDIHLEHRHPDGSLMHEHRDHDVVGKFSFFERLFGAGKPQTETYHSAVEQGLYVVIVEGHSDAEGERAQDVLHGMEARDVSLLHRAGERPLHEVVAERQGAGPLEQSFGTARDEMAPGHNADVRREGEFFPEERREPERAMASQGWGEQRRLDVVTEDKPIASPDLPLRDEDKPR